MTTGICEFATWLPVGTFGYPGRTAGQNQPLFFVDHIMAGWKSTMDRPGWQDSAGISAHFGIGQDGSISQYVNIFDASYANGLTGTIGETSFGKDKYDRSNRHLAAVENTPGATWRFLRLNGIPYWNLIDPEAGLSLLNARSITIEHEGVKPEAPWTRAMVEADLVVKFWCLQELQRDGYAPIVIDDDAIVGHHQIDPVNRPNCPGNGRPKATILARLAALASGQAHIETPEPPQLPPVQPTPSPPSDVPAPNGGHLHTVAKGETLWRIAVDYYGSGHRWPDILAVNESLLHGDEHNLRDGMEIRIP
jgi:N-acetylmuramoyl-L-alanine amidase/LysM domain